MNTPRMHRWQQAAEQLTTLLVSSPPQQQRQLQSLREQDAELAELTNTLLEATEVGGQMPEWQHAAGAEPLALEEGYRIGHFTIVEPIAVGGMGAVYRARQDAPARTVALKLLRGDMIDPSLRWRFSEEVGILGRLRHPGIAEVFEAGEFELGNTRLPYFAMAYVDGLTLDKHARSLALPLQERLELFLQLLDAVQHAHQQGVIHRDLKPANIMVDSAQRVRILDFGIARLQRRDGAGPTEAGMSPGTLAYMSPEQLTCNPADIDTRSDIYALGVILFELLSEKRAFDLAGASLMEAIEQRQWDSAPSLSKAYPGVHSDLDAIASKAMAGERDQRYATASEFANDIRRHLDNQPVSARRPGLLYLAGKFVRRRRGMSLALAALAASLILGVVATALAHQKAVTHQRLAQMQRDLALEAQAAAENVREYFNSLLALAAPDALGPELKVTDLIDQAEADLDERFAGLPAEQASLAQTIAWFRFLNADYRQAEILQTRAWQQHQALYGDNDARTVQSLSQLLNTRIFMGQHDAVAPIIQSHVENALTNLGEGHPDTLGAQHVLALWQHGQADLEGAEQTLRTALSQASGNEPTRQHARLTLFGLLGSILNEQGRHAEAEQTLRETLAIRIHSLGSFHPDTLITRSNLAETLTYQGQYQAAEALYRQVLEDAENVWDDDHATLIVVHTQLANTLAQQTRYDQAMHHAAHAYKQSLARWGEGHIETFAPLNTWLQMLFNLDRWSEAEPPARQLLSMAQTHFGANHPVTYHAHDMLATTFGGLERYSEAQEHARQAYEGTLQSYGPDHRNTLVKRNNLARIMESAGLGDSAHQEYQAVVTAWQQQYPDDHNSLARLNRNLGRSLIEAGHNEAALEALSRSLRHWRQLGNPDAGEIQATEALIEQAQSSAPSGKG